MVAAGSYRPVIRQLFGNFAREGDGLLCRQPPALGPLLPLNLVAGHFGQAVVEKVDRTVGQGGARVVAQSFCRATEAEKSIAIAAPISHERVQGQHEQNARVVSGCREYVQALFEVAVYMVE